VGGRGGGGGGGGVGGWGGGGSTPFGLHRGPPVHRCILLLFSELDFFFIRWAYFVIGIFQVKTVIQIYDLQYMKISLYADILSKVQLGARRNLGADPLPSA